ncbi:MAG: class I SAM-dependent methyltransferase [Chloroflexi bacterium]|nr:class I SAM-dependent methyltransferase [Chloroflexota bacterium]
MKERLTHLLKKWPPFYNLVARIYANLRPYLIAERIVGTRAREREWATRRDRKGNDWNNKRYPGKNEWVLSYWDSRNHSHRPFLTERIADFSPISSILEIGCNCGPNLYMIAQKFPGIKIQGIDINPLAIQKGKELFAAAGISNVKLSVGKADELSQFPDNSFDVVFTDAVLIYIGRDKIQGIIKEMVRVARKGLILVEQHICKPNNKANHSLGIRPYGLWQRDYVALLKQFVPEAQIGITKITEDMWADPQWQETGAIIEARLPKTANLGKKVLT